LPNLGSGLCHQVFHPYLEAMTVRFPFQNSYSALPDSFFTVNIDFRARLPVKPL